MIIKSLGLTFLILFINFTPVRSQKFTEKFKDSVDGAFDVSYFLKDLHGVLPIVSPITEPAVGYGAIGALLYFITKKDKEDVKRSKIPDIVGAAGGLTQNGTWFAGVGYLGFWKNDRIRYRGVIGYGDINLTYYSRFQFLPEDFSVEYGLKSIFLLQQVKFRLGDSNFFLGGKYTFGKTQIAFPRLIDIPGLEPRDFDLINSGIAIVGEYENFDNVFSPSRGMKIHLNYDQNLQILGSDRNWGKLSFASTFYFPVNRVWVPGLRIQSALATGDIPFYQRPFVELRGVPALRYQGDFTVAGETEQMFNITGRWSLLGFGGLGTAFRSLENFDAGDLVWNVGGGFRYLIAKLFGLRMGVDVARGPEDWAFYVVFGNSWLR